MKGIKTLIFVLAAAVLVFGMTSGPATAGEVVIKGSTTVLPIMQKAAEVYMQKNPGTDLSISGGGSGNGVKAIIDGTAQIGMASREMKGKEVDAAKAKGFTPVETVIALDCIVPIVHPSNPVSDLGTAQLKDIYTGKIKNWSQVGGPDKGIAVISRDSSSGTFEVWNEKVLNKEKVRPDAQLQASNGAVAQTVAGNKYAIGYVGIGYVNPELKAVTVNGISASVDTAKDKSYPISRGLNLYTPGEPEGEVKSIIEFICSPEGQKLVEEEGFVAYY